MTLPALESTLRLQKPEDGDVSEFKSYFEVELLQGIEPDRLRAGVSQGDEQLNFALRGWGVLRQPAEPTGSAKD